MKRENDEFFYSLNDDLKSLYCSIENSLCDYKCGDIELKSAVLDIMLNSIRYTETFVNKELKINNEDDTRTKKPD